MQSWKLTFALGATVAFASIISVISIGPARAEVISLLSCAHTTPCLEWDNSKSGDAIKGVSTNGTALHGQTKFKSAGKQTGKSGVLGEDLSTSGNLNSGVSGVSATGTGVTGTSTGWNGVFGSASASGVSGVYGQNTAGAGFGVAGRNTSASHDNGGAGVIADGGPANDGLHAISGSHSAVYAFSQTGTAFFANQGPDDDAPELYLQDSNGGNYIFQSVGPSGDVLDVAAGNTWAFGTFYISQAGLGNSGPALNVTAGTANTGAAVIQVINGNGILQTSFADNGNINTTGLITTGGSCHSGCLVGQKRVRSVGEYAPLATEPMIEDAGEATLVNGVAPVALDPKFANVIDTSSQYLVSITPEGDCKGLYVSNRTPSGFTVRELQGGRSNVSFEYRISAKRFGVQAPRLPMTAVQHETPPRAKPRM